MTTNHGGKGDTPRPIGVPMDQFDRNWDKIFSKPNPLADKLVKQIEENIKAHEYITPED